MALTKQLIFSLMVTAALSAVKDDIDDKEEWAAIAKSETEAHQHQENFPPADDYLANADLSIMSTENPKIRRPIFRSIKINGRGNVVIYLVRQPVPTNPAAPTQAVPGISNRQVITRTTKQKAKIDIAIRKVKLTTKRPAAATTKRSAVKISTSRKATAKVKIATRKAVVLKKSTVKKTVFKAITAKATSKKTKTLVSKKLVTIKDSTANDETTIPSTIPNLKAGMKSTSRATTSSFLYTLPGLNIPLAQNPPTLSTITSTTQNFTAPATPTTPTTFRFTPPVFNIPVMQTPPPTPAVFVPPFALPPAIFVPPLTPKPFVPPVVFNNPVPTAAALPFKPPVVLPMVPNVPPWIPQFGVPPSLIKTTAKTIATTTTTEFATVDLDSLIEEAESGTTPKSTDDMNAFGGLDIGGMVGGFLGGFAGPAEKPTASAAGGGIE